MTSTELENLMGRAITPQELARFLKLDVRTVRKYASRWGGVEVTPGKIRFFEKRVKEVLHAEFDLKARPGMCFYVAKATFDAIQLGIGVRLCDQECTKTN